MKRFAMAFLFSFVATSFAGAAMAQQPVEAGLDFLETRPGDTFEDLSDLSALCPGCFVIGNPLIPLKGVPLGGSPVCPGADLGSTDTIVRRLADTPPLFPGPPEFVPIEIVELHLQSVQPFQVDCSGDTQLWMLDVTIQNPLQPQGQMSIQRQDPNGGIFIYNNLPVQPLLTFTRVDIAPVVVCVAQPLFIWNQPDPHPWVHVPTSGQLEIPGCTSNFFAGVPGSRVAASSGVGAWTLVKADGSSWGLSWAVGGTVPAREATWGGVKALYR